MAGESHHALLWFESALMLSGWAICLLMLFYIPQRKEPSSARTWLLLIFLVPWLGLLLYILIRRAYMPRKRLRIQKKASERIQRAQEQYPRDDHAETSDTLRPIISLVNRVGEFQAVRGNSIEMLSEYEQSIRSLINDIEAAQHHVHLLYYIFEDDTTGRAIANALCSAARRGVTCRVLLDSIGSRPYAAFFSPTRNTANASSPPARAVTN